MPFETETKILYILLDVAVIFRLTGIFYNTLTSDYNIILL